MPSINFFVITHKLSTNWLVPNQMWSQFATSGTLKIKDSTSMPEKKAIIPVGKIEQRILLIRGEKIIVGADF